MSRYHRRIDANQPAIVKALRARGASVQSLASLGHGTPDLLIGYLGVNLLFECKDPEGAKARGTGVPSATALTEAEREWHQNWRGQVHIVLGVEGALELLGKIEAVTPQHFKDLAAAQRECEAESRAGEEWKNPEGRAEREP